MFCLVIFGDWFQIHNFCLVRSRKTPKKNSNRIWSLTQNKDHVTVMVLPLLTKNTPLYGNEENRKKLCVLQNECFTFLRKPIFRILAIPIWIWTRLDKTSCKDYPGLLIGWMVLKLGIFCMYYSWLHSH